MRVLALVNLLSAEGRIGSLACVTNYQLWAIGNLQRLYSQLQLLRGARNLRRLVGLARSSPEGILEVVVHGVVALTLSLRQGEDVEVELMIELQGILIVLV